MAVALIRQSVSSQVATLRLKARLIIYYLLVNGCTQDETIQIMGCTEWDEEGARLTLDVSFEELD